jgi:hypothetical protein
LTRSALALSAIERRLPAALAARADPRARRR